MPVPRAYVVLQRINLGLYAVLGSLNATANWRRMGAEMWTAVLVGSAGCYLLKLAGLSVPRRVLVDPRVRRIAGMLPIALLATLVALQTFSTGMRLGVDARAAGVAAALVAVLARAPFLVVVAIAVATTALVRLVH